MKSMSRPIHLLTAVLALLALPAATQERRAASTPPPPTAPAEGRNYVLRSVDRLQYRIEEDPVLGAAPMLVAVNSIGEASFPISRDSDIRITLSVRGKSLESVRRELASSLLKDYYHKATVILALDEKRLTAGKASFYGEVRGSIPLYPDEPPKTITEAILQLGYTDFADLRRVKLHREDPTTKSKTTKELDVRRIMKDNRRDLDIILEDGDRIEVPQKWIN